MVLLPEGKIGFVEVKAPGKKPRPLQAARHGLLRRLGFKVYVLDDQEQIEGYWMKYDRICDYCGEKITKRDRHGSHNKHHYCSKSCSDAAKVKKCWSNVTFVEDHS